MNQMKLNGKVAQIPVNSFKNISPFLKQFNFCKGHVSVMFNYLQEK